MKRTKISEIWAPELIGTDVCVKGWVRTRRGNKHVQFVALNDGSTIKNLQIVFDMEKFSDEDLKPITTGASIHVEGKLVESQGKGQTAEVQAETLEIYGTADPETYPLQKKDTLSNSCARRLICVRAQTLSARCSAYATRWLMQSTNSSTTVVSSISTRRSSHRATARVPALCFK